MILLNKLSHYGIRGIALDWFRSYLTGRQQYVRFAETDSERQSIKCGVPQGSVLGPLLFIIYMNDLPLSLTKSKCIMFADDTTVYCSGNNHADLIMTLKYDLEILIDWFRANKLSLNVSKTNYIVFRNRENSSEEKHSLKIGDMLINEVKSTKFLGLIVDNKLSWKEHTDHVHRKISSAMYALNAAKHSLGEKSLKLLYNSLIKSHLCYGLTLWGSAPKSCLHKLETTQKKAVRVVKHAKYNDHSLPLFRELNVLKITDLYKISIGKLMFKHSVSSLPSPLMKLFTLNRENHHYQTRHHNDPLHYRSNYAIAQNSFLSYGPKLWSTLNTAIKTAHTLKTFNNRLSKSIIDTY